ncbi:hypothetical protein A3SI_13517 [Nitritalea halalkaliphila LW7]|uniref:DUF481 domain-containing protein n=1 Tax=Nitritalea halalkaliphila LW7 TaxID=1189621 RepID=I5C0R8_9BACT|nr:DUF481 domain-containing protein [Nitritalea halalkaliphila]EIM75420.1 hypothetical protein A3SI_13517 [Nitritalea halalkaliphila LW7]
MNLFGYNLDFNTLYYPGKHAYMVVAKVDYLRINENDFLNFGFLHTRANFFRESTYNFEVMAQYSYDNFRGLDPRWVFGGSLRRVLAKSENLRLVLGVGAIYEEERWLIPGAEVPAFREVQFLKSSNYLSFRVSINDYVSLNTVNYYQVGYDRDFGFFRHRLNNSTVLNTKLSERLSLTNTFEIAYEDRPIVEITNLIYSFRTGIAFNF